MSNDHFPMLWRGLLSAALVLSAATAWAGAPVGAARLSAQDSVALDANQQIEVIVEFDQSAIEARAQTLRSQAALSSDTAEMLAERVQSYRQQKEQVFTALANEQITLQSNFSHLPMAVVKLRSPAAMQALLEQPGVKAVHSNVKLKRMLSRSLPLIGQPQTAAQGATGAGTTVAVLDSGADYTRSAFGSCSAAGAPGCKVVFAKDFAPEDNQADDSIYHGTNVAGIVLGVAPDTKIAALDVFEGESASSTVIIAAINWVIANKGTYNIVAMNLSLGYGESAEPCPNDAFATPIANARAAGIIAAVSSGNDGYNNKLSIPACVPAAVSVGAVYSSDFGPVSFGDCTDNQTAVDQIACFSNSSPTLTLLAPGARIYAADISMSGTSQAAPHVAGALTVLRAAYPNESMDAIVARLVNTGVPVTDAKNGITKPRINLLAAYGGSSPPTSTSKLINISTRGAVGTGDNLMIAGFVINGSESKRVLITAKGPSLAAYNVADPLADPTLTIYNSSGQQIDFNDNWGDAPNVGEIAGIGPHPTDPLEAAILTTLQPGLYTAIVRGANSTTGNGLVEVYDRNATASAKLINISTRGAVGTGANVMIAGFVIKGSESKRVLITGKGPSLAAYNVSNVLADPTLTIYNSSGQQIDFNDNWGDAPNVGEIAASAPHPTNPLEAAILTTLQPGLYTAIVRGVSNATGNGQVEVYDRDPK